MTEEFPSNSHASRKDKERPQVEKVVEGTVVLRKAPLGTRVREAFFSGAADETIGSFLLFHVVIPALKDLTFNTGTEALNKLLYSSARAEEIRRGAPSRVSTPYGKISTISAGGRTPKAPVISDFGRAQHRFEELLFPTRSDAERVLDGMMDLLDDFQIVTVSDLYDLAGLSDDFTDRKWGWDNLSTARVEPVRQGYWVRLPKPKPLE